MSICIFFVKVTKKDIVDVELVKKFEDLFQEIPGLPPKRETEFNIDMVSWMRLASKPVYRMTPKKLE